MFLSNLALLSALTRFSQHTRHMNRRTIITSALLGFATYLMIKFDQLEWSQDGAAAAEEVRTSRKVDRDPCGSLQSEAVKRCRKIQDFCTKFRTLKRLAFSGA